MTKKPILPWREIRSGELEQTGHLTLVSDDTALMAKFSGSTARAFRDLNRVAFFSGDCEQVEDYLSTINDTLRKKLLAEQT